MPDNAPVREYRVRGVSCEVRRSVVKGLIYEIIDPDGSRVTLYRYQLPHLLALAELLEAAEVRSVRWEDREAAV